MSASTTVQPSLRYKDQIKLERAEMAASWLAIAVDCLIGQTKGASPTTGDDDGSERPRWFGAYY